MQDDLLEFAITGQTRFEARIVESMSCTFSPKMILGLWLMLYSIHILAVSAVGPQPCVTRRTLAMRWLIQLAQLFANKARRKDITCIHCNMSASYSAVSNIA